MADQQPSNPELSLSAVVFTIFLCIIFGSNAVAVKIAFSGIGVFTSAAIRFGIASVAIFLWARITGQTISLKEGQFHQVLIFSLLFTVQLSLFYLGLSKSNASRGTLLANLVPFFILFLAHFFIPGDRITRKKFFGILLGFAGVIFMFIDEEAIQAGLRTGDLIILCAVTIWACATVYLKRIIGTFSPFQLVMYSTLFSVPLFLVAALLWDKAMIFQLNAPVIGAILYQSLITASFGFVAWNTMLKKIRGRIPALVHVHYADCRRGSGRFGFRRADILEDSSGSGVYCFRHISGSLASQKRSTGLSCLKKIQIGD